MTMKFENETPKNAMLVDLDDMNSIRSCHAALGAIIRMADRLQIKAVTDEIVSKALTPPEDNPESTKIRRSFVPVHRMTDQRREETDRKYNPEYLTDLEQALFDLLPKDREFTNQDLMDMKVGEAIGCAPQSVGAAVSVLMRKGRVEKLGTTRSRYALYRVKQNTPGAVEFSG